MPERDELDHLIDSELANYAEPRAGLEQRILAQVSAERSKHVWTVPVWRRRALAGAVAALAIVMVVVALSRTAHRETEINTARATSPDRGAVVSSKNQTPEARIQTPNSKQNAKTSKNVARQPRPAALPEHVQRPKLDVFPAPQPLSAQEQALADLATHLPETERERLFSVRKSEDAPLEISTIKISPITLPNLGKN